MGKALFYICFLLFGPLIAYNDGGAILTDFSVRSEKLVETNIVTTNRKCASTFSVFHQCSFNYESDGEAHDANYYIFAFGAPKTVHLLRGTETGRITSTVGQDYLWHRLLTIIFGFLVSGFMLFALYRALISMGDESGETIDYAPQTPKPNRHQTTASSSHATQNGRQQFGRSKSFGTR